MIRRPPRSTLFPYTRSSDLGGRGLDVGARARECQIACGGRRRDRGAPTRARSEEHTSELQSRRDLVCRLLLEKKKRKKRKTKQKKQKKKRDKNAVGVEQHKQ